jgi:hypothetical protein
MWLENKSPAASWCIQTHKVTCCDTGVFPIATDMVLRRCCDHHDHATQHVHVADSNMTSALDDSTSANTTSVHASDDSHPNDSGRLASMHA